MEFLTTLFIIEMIAVVGATSEAHYKHEMVRRWRAGSLNEVELKWLNRQTWFSRQFNEASCEPDKKSN
jgi:hypothetical protein